jgi:hypothetical protein
VTAVRKPAATIARGVEDVCSQTCHDIAYIMIGRLLGLAPDRPSMVDASHGAMPISTSG